MMMKVMAIVMAKTLVMVKVVCDGKSGDGDDRNRIKTIILFIIRIACNV